MLIRNQGTSSHHTDTKCYLLVLLVSKGPPAQWSNDSPQWWLLWYPQWVTVTGTAIYIFLVFGLEGAVVLHMSHINFSVHATIYPLFLLLFIIKHKYLCLFLSYFTWQFQRIWYQTVHMHVVKRCLFCYCLWSNLCRSLWETGRYHLQCRVLVYNYVCNHLSGDWKIQQSCQIMMRGPRNYPVNILMRYQMGIFYQQTTWLRLLSVFVFANFRRPIKVWFSFKILC